MRIFYTGSDIEDLAASGVQQLEVGPGVALTDAARERAEELGIALVAPSGKTAMPGSQPASKAAAAAPPKAGSLPAKPRGCQHGALGGGAASAGRQNPTVDQLVDAVSALKKRGG
jgi:hypothetical protein